MAAERNRKAARLVGKALIYESKGSDEVRNAMLIAAREKLPDFAPALWHSGYVQHQGEWIKFDEFSESAAQNMWLEPYRKVRPRYADTVAGQMALAAWCTKRKLPEQRRAHLSRVLSLDPENAEARRLLGLQLFDGRWLTEAELYEARQQAAETSTALARWRKQLEKIRAGFAHEKRLNREVAAERLRAIEDPEAVPAIEEALFNVSEPAALAAVDTLAAISAHEAAATLTRWGVFSPWVSVREAAAEALSSRKMDDYVPLLLSALSSPLEVRSELMFSPRGRQFYRFTLTREQQARNEVAVVDTPNLFVAPTAGGWGRGWSPGVMMTGQPDPSMFNWEQEQNVARLNAATQLRNRRIIEVLTAATGQDESWETPQEWWDWWNERNDVFLPDGKPQQTVYRLQQTMLVRNDPIMPEFEQLPSYVPPTLPLPSPSPPRQGYECLAAGTPVWTDMGTVPVEEVQVGDRVLSQHPETGCLDFKVVLQTTERPAERLIHILADGRTIESSAGHAFWVNGQGWVIARDLVADTQMHCVTGSARVEWAGLGRIAPTYNLVVDDFHTFFIGPSKILTHDNTTRQPTNAVVPGLVRE